MEFYLINKQGNGAIVGREIGVIRTYTLIFEAQSSSVRLQKLRDKKLRDNR
jgi:hypothetical protein